MVMARTATSRPESTGAVPCERRAWPPDSAARENGPVEPVHPVAVRRGHERRSSTELGRDGCLELRELRMRLEERTDNILVLLGSNGTRDVDDPSTGTDACNGGLEQRQLDRRPPGEGPHVRPPADVRTA